MIESVLRNKIYILLAVVVLFAAILRFYKIAEIPVSLYWDEVSSTYNAYSLLSTGKDEFGNSFPFLFRAFEDYKTPANIYLTTIPVKLFGLNEFSARFTSAFLGTLTVVVCFFLIKELLGKKYLGVPPPYFALLTSFLVAISPWHIQFSRTGFEANVGLFFVVLAATLFFKFINSKNFNYFFASSLVFAASIYFYRSIWVFAPLLLLALVFINKDFLFIKDNLRKTLLGLFLFVLIVLPFIPQMASVQGRVRIDQTAVFNNSAEKVYEYSKKQEEVGGVVGKIVYNRRVAWTVESAKGYLSHFLPQFLFISGDGNRRHGVEGVGVLYLWGALFILPGLFAFWKMDKKIKLAVLSWLILAPVPAAISLPAPHALRSLNMIPMPQFLIALGMIWVFVRLSTKQRIIYSSITAVIILFFFISYLVSYYGPNAIKSSSEWGDGYKQLTEYVFANENKYDKVVVSGHYWQPYVYFLFYKNYDPFLFQESGSKKGFDKYIFGGTSWDRGKELGDQNLESLAGTKNALIALSPVEYNLQKNNIEVVKEIKNHNNELVFIVGELR